MENYQDYKLRRPDYHIYDEPMTHGGYREGSGRKPNWQRGDYPLVTARLPKELADAIIHLRESGISSQQIINSLQG